MTFESKVESKSVESSTVSVADIANGAFNLNSRISLIQTHVALHMHVTLVFSSAHVKFDV